MGFFTGIKPSKKRVKMLKEHLESGRILSVNEDKDNKKLIKEIDDVSKQD